MPPPLMLLLVVVLASAPASGILHRPAGGVDKVPAEAWLTTPELVTRWGYPVETHTIRTDDGYLLEVHRIPGPRRGRGAADGERPSSATSSGPSNTRTPVLLNHGFGATSECMVLRGHKALAPMMADAGLDVWIGNFRGTFYGRRHVSLSAVDPRFWDFSWHENGVHDTSAMIDYILRETKQPSLLYSGHSMGATALLVLLAERPEYGAKVRASFLLTPAAYFQHVRGGFSKIRHNLRWAYNSLAALRLENALTRRPLPQLCMSANGMAVSPRCLQFLEDAQGPFHSVANNTYLPVLLRHWPGGTSLGQAFHFGQLIIRGDGFYKYDYGPSKNLEKYGTVYPPAYNLTNVQSPTFIYYCQNDYQAHYKDVKKLAADIPGLAGLYLTAAETFNHIDIIYDEDAAELVYVRLIEQMMKYR